MTRLIWIILSFLAFLFSCNYKNEDFKISGHSYNSFSTKELESELLFIDELYGKNAISQIEMLQKLDSLHFYAEKVGLKETLPDIYRRVGNIYLQSGNLEEAATYLLKSMTISAEINDSTRYYGSAINLSGIYLYLKLPQKAKFYAEKTLLYSERINFKILKANAAANYSMILSNLNEKEKAAEIAKKALSYKLSIPESQAVYKADSCEFLINTIALNKLVSVTISDSLVNLLSKWVKSESYIPLKCRIYAFLANYSTSNNKSLAADYKDSAFKYLRDEMLNEDKLVVYSDLRDYFFHSKIYDSAYLYSELTLTLNDSFYNSEKLKIVANSNNLFEMLINNEIKLLKIEKTKMNGWIVGLSIGIFLLILTVVLYHQNIKQKLRIKSSRINELIQSQELSIIDATLSGQDKERQRIAQELHDGIGSNLARAKMHFSVMESELDRLKEFNKEQYFEMTNILEETLNDVRRISHDMFGSTVLNLGLKVATQQLLDAVEKSYNIKAKLYTKNLDVMEYDVEINIYRIIQELVSNSLKHSDSKRLDVQLIRELNNLHLAYEDNGKGFDASADNLKQGLGLLSMKNRIIALKGTYKIDSKPGNGFVLFADFPLSNKTI